MNYKISDKYREQNLSEWGKPNYIYDGKIQENK